MVAMSAIDPHHSLHPCPGRASLVPRLGHRQQRLLSMLAEAGVTTTVSPLHFMAYNRELALFAIAAAPMGLALDPMTHLRQLPPSFRGAAYRRQPHGEGPAFLPDSDAISAAQIIDLAESPLDAQRAHGATLLMTSYHLCGPVGSRGRELDLHLTRLGAEHFQAERMEQPAEHAAVQVPRQLFASLAVEADVVRSPAAVEALAAAYAELDVAGYWVKIEGFWQRGSLRELRGAGALLGALSETGRAVVSCGPGALHLPLLVADISSSVGLGESERFAMPDIRRPRPSGPRQRIAYHPAFIHSFQVGERPARRAFTTVPCRCGRHSKARPPQGGDADEHCAIMRAREAREAMEGSREERREWLQATAAMASHVAHDAGVDVVPYATLEAVLHGVDAGRGDLAQVS
jgi:hypothetical protein